MRCGERGRHVKKICQWHIFSVDLSGYAAVASFLVCTASSFSPDLSGYAAVASILGYAAHIEVRWAGSANPAHLSMESCGSAPRSAAGRKKAHSHTQPCEKEKRTAKAGRAQITLRASASGMAKAQEQRIAYLTYPVRAGITVTFSRGLSPHSAASPARPARRPVLQFSSIVRHVAANCKREFALRRFFSCAVGQRLSPAPRSALTSPPAGWRRSRRCPATRRPPWRPRPAPASPRRRCCRQAPAPGSAAPHSRR